MIQTRDVTQLLPVTKFQAHSKYITRVLLSPDVQKLATCSADQTAKIWNVDDKKFSLESTLHGHQRWVWDCAFSADSAYLVTACSDHYARLWELSRYVNSMVGRRQVLMKKQSDDYSAIYWTSSWSSLCGIE